MLIKGRKQRTLLWQAIFGILSILLMLYVGKRLYDNYYPNYLLNSSISNKDIIHFDAENIWENQFYSNGHWFGGVENQTDTMSFSGDYSCRIKKGASTQYGVTHIIKKPEPGLFYETTVWVNKGQYKNGRIVLVAAIPNDTSFYVESEKVVKHYREGWMQLRNTVQIPYHKKAEELKVYLYSDGHHDYFYDDFKIRTFQSEQAHFDIETINVDIKEKNYNRLKEKRKEALRAGVLVTSEDSWVKGNLEDSSGIYPAQLRLKGDWLDHLRGDKWSFRVKLKSGYAWRHMTSFSLQTPKSRYHTYEWVLHQLFEREDVLTTRYDFVHLKVNGEVRGVYAIEEHFEKQLVESKSRREGPLLRFSEDAYWDTNRRNLELGIYRGINTQVAKVENAPISTFKESKLKKSSALMQQFEIAQNLMLQFQKGLQPASEIFDIELLAKYYAIIDVMGAYHAAYWHNQRFYYNPIIGKLEPIGFDGFAGGDMKLDIMGYRAYRNQIGRPQVMLFQDEAFAERYFYFLDKFSSTDYLETFFDSIQKGLDERTAFIQNEFPDFEFKKDKLIKRATEVRRYIQPFEAHSVASNWTSKGKDRQLKVKNLHEYPVQIVGYSANEQLRDTLVKQPIIFPNVNSKMKVVLEVDAPSETRFVFFKLPGLKNVLHTRVSSFVEPQNASPVQALMANNTLESTSYFSVEDKVIRFQRGKHTITKDIIIPKGYRVQFDAGTVLNFINKTKFISHSPLLMNGLEKDPIVIYSEDKTMNGFTVLQTDQRSELYHVRFENMNTLNYEGWMLTGAVNFYESDVKIRDCVFTQNHCEDALNIFRSNFDIVRITVSETFADGFDADFCQGKLNDSFFINTGNDGLDVSGSELTVFNCQFQGCGDKAISVGEASKMNVLSATISGAVIGLASKDKSELTIEQVSLDNCKQGFAAYQKKPEFGSSKITVKEYTAKNVTYLYMLGNGSTLQLEDQLIVGE